MSYRNENTRIGLKPNIVEKIDFITNVFDTSIQATANWILEKSIDTVIEQIKEFEKNINPQLKEAIRQSIKKHYTIETNNRNTKIKKGV